MPSDSDDDVPLGARTTGGSQPASRPVVAPPQRAAAAGIQYAESSDDEAPLISRQQPKGKSNKPASGMKAAAKVKPQEERQSAAQAGPVSEAKQAAVKQAAAEMLRDDRRDAARQAAKKQAAVKDSAKRPQKPAANGIVVEAHGKRVSSKMPVIPTATPARQTGSKKGKVAPVRKTFDIPNQRKDTPEASDPLRIFYESTRDQMAALKDDNGNSRRSFMCDSWLLDHGLIPSAEIPEVARYVGIEKQKVKNPSPTKGKAPSSNGRPNKQIAARKEALKSKPPNKKPAPAPIPIKKPLLPASKRAAVDKRVKAEATLAAMGGSSDDDDDIPFSKRIKN